MRILLGALLVLSFAGGASAADMLPALSIDDVMTQETNFDTDAVLTVTLAPASTQTVTVTYATVNGTADTTDYVATSGIATFAPGATTLRLPVEIKGDALDEPDETLFVDLSAATNATISRARGTVTILDDAADSSPARILDATVRAKWNVHPRYTRVTRLEVTSAPAGASITAHCAGKGCPFNQKRTGSKVTAAFGRAKLRPGTKVQLWIDAPGMIGKVFEYAMRASKAPRVRTLCLLPAATKPSAC